MINPRWLRANRDAENVTTSQRFSDSSFDRLDAECVLWEQSFQYHQEADDAQYDRANGHQDGLPAEAAGDVGGALRQPRSG
jgi:hypothetical protein